MLRYDWTVNELEEIFYLPFPELIFRAQSIHRRFFRPDRVQCSTLLSVKTGGCSEDCGYCSQSSRYETGLERRGVLPLADVMASAQAAKDQGASRFCMGAAWRQVKDNGDFEKILEMVREVSSLGLQVCCTLGMLTPEQAARLKEAGCYAYNHNLDTSPEYYNKVVTTRTYQDRLNTIEAVRDAGMTVCCGGIIGLGESPADRLGLLTQLASQDPHPESVPINMLVPIEGTPLGASPKVDPFDFVRIIATARIVMPTSMVRLSAGRLQMSPELQALCFLAGANSIFLGDKLLTTDNPSQEDDLGLLARLGMEPADDVGIRVGGSNYSSRPISPW